MGTQRIPADTACRRNIKCDFSLIYMMLKALTNV